MLYEPAEDASQRTKNRLREHNFEIGSQITRLDHLPALRGEPGVLLACIGHCNWLGWLPVHEIKFSPLRTGVQG